MKVRHQAKRRMARAFPHRRKEQEFNAYLAAFTASLRDSVRKSPLLNPASAEVGGAE